MSISIQRPPNVQNCRFIMLSVWAVAVLVGGALLVLKHELPLPETEAPVRALEVAIAGTRIAGERGRWLVVHVLYEKCGCSARLIGESLPCSGWQRSAGVAPTSWAWVTTAAWPAC